MRLIGIAAVAAAIVQAPQPLRASVPILCGGEVATIVGTPGNDHLIGSDGPDVIAGLQGDDRIEGLSGDDVLCGGRGDDVIYGGQGFDVIYGAEGDDYIYSADGGTLTARNDIRGVRAFGGQGNDVIYGSNRWDRMQGGPGQDQLLGYEGRDWMRGGPQSDVIDGGPGIDDLHGGNDNDSLVVSHRDRVRGGAGYADTCHSTGTQREKRSCEIEGQPLGDCGQTLDYRPTIVGGWRVCVAGPLDRGSRQISTRALNLLQSDLATVRGVLPTEALRHVKTVTVWLEEDVPAFPGGVYHPSETWLLDNGYPPEWAGGIQLGNAVNYLSWTSQQPGIVLHELSHAYHDQILGFDYGPVVDAYAAVMASGIYESVEHANGGFSRAYATTNSTEYFAELTEALFWRNDYFPFEKDQLSNHDPGGYDVVSRAWTVDR